MKLYINEINERKRIALESPEFFAIEIELPDKLGKQLLAFEQKIITYRTYLDKLAAQLSTRTDTDLTKVEVPECLVTAEAPSAEQPKKKATAPRSSSKSQAKRKEIQSRSRTSPKTDE